MQISIHCDPKFVIKNIYSLNNNVLTKCKYEFPCIKAKYKWNNLPLDKQHKRCHPTKLSSYHCQKHESMSVRVFVKNFSRNALRITRAVKLLPFQTQMSELSNF